MWPWLHHYTSGFLTLYEERIKLLCCNVFRSVVKSTLWKIRCVFLSKYSLVLQETWNLWRPSCFPELRVKVNCFQPEVSLVVQILLPLYGDFFFYFSELFGASKIFKLEDTFKMLILFSCHTSLFFFLVSVHWHFRDLSKCKEPFGNSPLLRLGLESLSSLVCMQLNRAPILLLRSFPGIE